MRFATLLTAAAIAGSASAFTSPQPTVVSRDAVKLNIIEEPKDISYGEESRLYRRTIYTHDDWVKHRSPNRFIKNLRALSSSGIYKNISKEIGAVTAVATLIVGWNAAFGGYTDFDGVAHDALVSGVPLLGLPLTPFTLLSPSLGLLLVFRTNTSYKRWDEARKNWGMNINHTRDLVRMVTTWYDPRYATRENYYGSGMEMPPMPRVSDMTQEQLDERAEKLQNVALATWAFVRSMKRQLSPEWEDEEAFKEELFQKLPSGQAQAIIDAAHRPNRALFDLSVAIEDCPMHFLRKNQVQEAVTIFEDNLGSSERLLNSPVPLFYTRHLARFLSTWLLLLPFGMYGAFSGTWNHVGEIPAMLIVSLFMFGIEELGIQLEEPFTVLPMQAYCDRIGNWCNEIVSWTAGDNEPDAIPAEPKMSARDRFLKIGR